MAKPKVLITGASGLLGLTWAQLVHDSHEVFAGLNQRRVSVPNAWGVDTDLTSYGAIQRLIEGHGIDTVVHCAAMTSVDACEADPETAKLVNVVAAENVAIACAGSGAKLIHISTDHLFSGDRPIYSETDAVEPVNVYARTKAAAEEAVLKRHGRALIVRTNFYGWGPTYRQSFSDWVISALENKRPVHMFTDVRYTPILASVLVTACMDLQAIGAIGVYNVVSDAPLSKYDFGRVLTARFGLDLELVHPDLFTQRATMVQRPRNMALANEKAKRALGRPLGTTRQHVDLLFQQRDLAWSQRVRDLTG